MNIPALTGLVLLLGTTVLLAATNPTTEEYQAFLETSLARALDQMATQSQQTSEPQELVRSLLRTQGKPLIQSLVRTNTVRRNYGLFSLFETTVLGVRVRVLGVMSRFIPLEDEKEIVKRFQETLR